VEISRRDNREGLGFSRANKARIEGRLQPLGKSPVAERRNKNSPEPALSVVEGTSVLGQCQRDGTESRRDGRNGACLLLLFAEVIRINPLRFVRRHGCDTNVEVDHQVGQMVAVNQHDLGVNLLHVLLRIG